jgi:uncharacterized protein YndB with AHSA1/START domain
MSEEGMLRLERTYDAAPEAVWRLWTTAEGIASWWAPDGFAVEVHALDLRPGGELRYAMTATGQEQVDFLRSAGLPLSTEARKTFTEIAEPSRLAYTSLVDFVPGQEPYDQLTVVELTPAGDGVRVVMHMEPLHDADWTERLVAGRTNELENLAAVLARRSA